MILFWLYKKTVVYIKGIISKRTGHIHFGLVQKQTTNFKKMSYTLKFRYGTLNYYRISPFIGFERKGGTNIDYYIFAKNNNPLTGGATYNYLSKSGKKTDLEWNELINTGIKSDGNNSSKQKE